MSAPLEQVAEQLTQQQPKKHKKVQPTPPHPHVMKIPNARLRACHVMSLLSVSHSEFYRRLATGRAPKCSGRDPQPDWNVQAINEWLDAKK